MSADACSLCGGPVVGHGHNPEPLARHDARCCDECNTTRVIPARLFGVTADEALVDAAVERMRLDRTAVSGDDLDEFTDEQLANPEFARAYVRKQDEHIERLQSEVKYLRGVIAQAARELEEFHSPEWMSDEAKAAGKEPIGCELCYPGDGSWPCMTRMVADDLRNVRP